MITVIDFSRVFSDADSSNRVYFGTDIGKLVEYSQVLNKFVDGSPVNREI